MTDFLHRLAHLFGWTTGRVYSWWDSDTGALMMAFKCDKCGDLLHVFEEKAVPRRKTLRRVK